MAQLKPFADDLETELTCSICQEIFNEPKTLSCLHSYCKKCIVQWYERSGSQETKGFDCPICKTRIYVPDGDASKLRSSFYLDSLLQLLEAMRARSDQEHSAGLSGCMSCETHVELVAFCPQCNGLICNDCASAHKQVKHLRLEHQAQMLADFKQENVESFVKTQIFCQEQFHERNKLEYYCREESCKQCVCQKCAFLKHRNHDMLGIDEAADQARHSIEEDMKRVMTLKEKYEEQLAQSKRNMARIENETELAMEKVDRVVESIFKMASDYKTAMSKELKGILTEQREANCEEQNDIKAGIDELATFLLRCQTLLDKSAASEISVAKEDLQKRCQSYSEKPLILPSKPIQRNVSVRYVTNQKVTQSIQNVGKIVASLTDPLQCTIESLKEVRCGFVNEFVIITRNADDKVCHTDKGSIDVRIKDPEGKEVVKRVIEEGTGRYSVSYRAEKVVQYEVQVNIAGHPMKNSPQKINTLDIKSEFVHVKTFLGVKESEGEVTECNVFNKIFVSDVHEKIAVTDNQSRLVKIFDLEGNYLREFEVVFPGIDSQDTQGVILADAGFNEDKIFVSLWSKDNEQCVVQKLDLKGTLLESIFGPRQDFFATTLWITDDQHLALGGVTKNEEGNVKPCIMLLSEQGHSLHKIDLIGEDEEEVSLFFITYNNGRCFLSFLAKNCIRVFDKQGVFLYQFGEKGEGASQFDEVTGHAGYGPDMILVCDSNNHRVQLLTTNGEFITSFSKYGVDDKMHFPLDVAVGADGKVFVLQFDGSVHIWR